MMLKLLAGDISKLEGSIMKEPIVKSSGNVFLDLGFPPEEAAILQMRSGDHGRYTEDHQKQEADAS